MADSAARKLNEIMRQSLSLAFWRRPRSPVVLVGFGSFLFACAFALATFEVQDIRNADPGSMFYPDGLPLHASYFLCVLIATWLASWLLRRPALWLTLASLVVLVGIPWMALALQLPVWLADADDLQLEAWQILLALGAFVALLRVIGFAARDAAIFRRFVATALIASLLTGPWIWRQSAWLWYAPDDQDEQSDPPDVENADARPAPPSSTRKRCYTGNRRCSGNASTACARRRRERSICTHWGLPATAASRCSAMKSTISMP